MPPTVAPDFVGVNIVVGVLDHRQINAIGAQAGNEFFQQRGLAAAGIADKGEIYRGKASL
jgi:hypothetical protein